MKSFPPQKKPSDSKTPKTNIKNQNNHKNHQQNKFLELSKKKKKGKGSVQEICTNLMEVWEQLIYNCQCQFGSLNQNQSFFK